MKKRTVVPGLLICVAISVTGCWVERDAYGKLRIYGPREFRARERYLKEMEPRRFAQMRGRKRAGSGALVIGGVGLGIGLVYAANHDAWCDDDNNDEVAAGVAAVGAVSLFVGLVANSLGNIQYDNYVKKAGRRRAQLLLAPNGALLTYRF
jgi:hypothetical protein